MGDLAAHLLKQQDSLAARLERAEKERDEAVSIVREMREMCTCLSGAAASLIDAFLSRVGAKEEGK